MIVLNLITIAAIVAAIVLWETSADKGDNTLHAVKWCAVGIAVVGIVVWVSR